MPKLVGKDKPSLWPAEANSRVCALCPTAQRCSREQVVDETKSNDARSFCRTGRVAIAVAKKVPVRKLELHNRVVFDFNILLGYRCARSVRINQRCSISAEVRHYF